MKKKLLVLTAALSLTLTSLAPNASFAATKNGTDINGDTRVPLQVGDVMSSKTPPEYIDNAAHAAASWDAREMIEKLMNELNSSPKKLGYEKGSKLTIKISDGTFRDKGGQQFYFKGWTTITKFSLDHNDSDPSLDISYNPSTKEFTIEKIKDQNPTGDLRIFADMNYNFQTWEWYTMFWVRLNDRAGKFTYKPKVKFTNFETAPKLHERA
ncbi:toxin-like protein [Paenibacillus larvae subsp. larvae]|uniref:Toxin-like protein n=1 Tax=Paenibacillus larvae subsp. larvae TaxID=147375 RepID=A0A2L1UAE0_9BACL|nr:hypothetical protein [Paenibacillus larvae]AQT85722.1 hypothetical protein B1222_17000 [Paenibacillus larvae subsp. pulvifaciens]AQZ47689.1 hypothetical protein B5S25_15000 [Paenibacillus larvae subsp. pulvifaciens]AVF25119.1 toxin-like protein [Paenibacillus larvae subsp. larvae]AVF29896.1 toxin-like protein [Paenibacillus larvae subsp. larvae]MBH0342376.1 hypothetical protein [Paenibacillus larvae]